ncbi:uncharacterized protein METZ01_LOCUS456554, partial [marine metagenome]
VIDFSYSFNAIAPGELIKYLKIVGVHFIDRTINATPVLGWQGNAVKAVRLSHCVRAHVEEFYPRADGQWIIEGILTKHIPRKAGAARQGVGMKAAVNMAKDVRLKLKLKNLRHVVYGSIKNSDLGIITAEDVVHCRLNSAAAPDD